MMAEINRKKINKESKSLIRKQNKVSKDVSDKQKEILK